MSIERSFRDKLNLSKRIPLHYQKRYLANISNGSFNTTLRTGVYKNKIKTLLKTNRVLALTLQNDRVKKEALMAESQTNASLIMFSRLKLASMSENLKKVVSVLDETLTLLQMHSSATSSKFMPKNTVSREEFKEQVKEVYMCAIPEEPESPERKEEVTIQVPKEHIGVAGKTNAANEEIHPKAYSKKLRGKRQSYIQQRHCKKEKNVFNLSDLLLTPTHQIDNSIQINDKNNVCSQPVVPVTDNNECNFLGENCSPRDNTSQVNKGLTKNKIVKFEAEKNKCPQSTITPVTKKSKVPKNTNNNGGTGIGCFSINLNSKKKGRSLNRLNPSKLRNDVQILEDIPSPKRKIDKNDETSVIDIPSQDKNLNIVPGGSPLKNVNDTYIISNCEKENMESAKTPKSSPSSKRKLTLDVVETRAKTKRSSRVRNSALKNLSSEINIENLKKNKIENNKSNCEFDDLLCIGTKDQCFCVSDESKVCSCLSIDSKFIHGAPNTRNTEISKKSRNFKKQEITRDLPENTFLVAAKVPTSSKNIKPNALQIDQPCVTTLNPCVLVQDIFQSSKSICKNILGNLSDELHTKSLELKLLDHSSSLKMIPEESIHTESSISVGSDQSVKKDLKRGTRVAESVEESTEEPSHKEKRANRRHSSVCYKEPPVNIKMRR